MKTYVFYDALIESQDGKTRRCLLKFPADKKLSDLSPKDLRGVGKNKEDEARRQKIF